MKANRLLTLLQEITHQDSRIRERGADQAADFTTSYSSVETTALTTVLSVSAACEKDHAALEAQLHTILELTSSGHIEMDHLSHLRQVNIGKLPPKLQEYMNDLLEN